MQEDIQKDEQVSNTSKIGLSIGLVLLAMIPTTDYYVAKDEPVNGREIKGSVTSYELSSTKDFLKNLVSSGTNPTINQVYALEDIVNYNCPNGFSMGEIKGGITTAQINKLIDGDCGI